MKKSTLFFKVMVLLALLVPWTGWGRSSLPEGVNEDDIIGWRVMILDKDNKIPRDNSQGGKNFSVTDFTSIGDNNLSGWTLTGDVAPDKSSAGVPNLKIQGQVQFKGGDGPVKVDAIYIKVKNTDGDTKWLRYGFASEGDKVITALNVSYTGGGNGSRPYNGKALTADEVKTGLTVTATIGDKTETITDYTITTTLTDCVDADTYTINIKVNGEYAGQTTGSTTFEIVKRLISVTIKEDAKLEFEIGTNEPTLAASEYLQVTTVEGEDESVWFLLKLRHSQVI